MGLEEARSWSSLSSEKSGGGGLTARPGCERRDGVSRRHVGGTYATSAIKSFRVRAGNERERALLPRSRVSTETTPNGRAAGAPFAPAVVRGTDRAALPLAPNGQRERREDRQEGDADPEAGEAVTAAVGATV